jgi:hypothetical protein
MPVVQQLSELIGQILEALRARMEPIVGIAILDRDFSGSLIYPGWNEHLTRRSECQHIWGHFQRCRTRYHLLRLVQCRHH